MNLSEEQLKEVKKVFDMLDKNKNGFLSSKEFKDGLQVRMKTQQTPPLPSLLSYITL